MSAEPQAAASGRLAAVHSAADTVRPGGPSDAAGRLLGRLTVLPALLAMAWLLAGLPLLLAGSFTAVLMLVAATPLAAVLVTLGLRRTPGRWQAARTAPAADATAAPWWAVAGVLAVAVAFAVWQLAYHSQQVIVVRDPASYFQFGAWIAQHGSLPIPQDRAAFGGAHPGLSFGSPAFFQVGSSLVPQFMAGLPMVLAGGFWAGGAGLAAAMAPLFGAGAVLSFGGLAARLAGPRWAPLAAGVLALTLPEQVTSRSVYSEPLAQILFLGGLCLVIDSLERGTAGARVIAALGGLALGLIVLVRIDGVSDILPVIPYSGLLLIGRQRQALPLLGGLVAGGAFGAVDGLVLSRPYLASIKTSLIPLTGVAVAVVAATAVGVAVARRRGLPALGRTWLPNAAAALAVAAMIVLTIRPYFMRPAHLAHLLASHERSGHLPAALQNWLYSLSVHWVFWYLGAPAVALGAVGAAVLARRCLRGEAPHWTLPLMAFGWIIVTVLYRPAIVPIQPWASRRLVPGVLPGLILLAVWAAGWLADWARRGGRGRIAGGSVAAVSSVALLAPPAMTTFGVQFTAGGPAGVTLSADGMAFKRTYAGELGAVSRLCAAIPRNASVVVIDGRLARQFTEVVRGMCGEPAAVAAGLRPASVTPVLQAIARAGRTPVLLAASPVELAPYRGSAREVVALQTRGDGRHLTAAPLGTTKFAVSVWVSQPRA